MGEERKDRNHQAQVLRSLSFIVEHRSPKEAEKLLERSLDLNRQIKNRFGENLVRRGAVFLSQSMTEEGV
jgi:hypothetical protein